MAIRAKNGDIAAYEELVRRYQDVAFRTAIVILGDAGEAEDAAQEGFIKAYAALETFRPGATFRPWVLKIVANEARNRKRSAGRRYFLTQRVERINPPLAVAPSPEQATLDDELRADIQKQLNALSEMDRIVITYRYFFNMSEAEMADALDIAPGTVKSRLSRAKQHLKQRLTGSETDRN